MNSKTGRMIVSGMLLVMLVCLAAGVVLYQLGNNTGLADFKANQPFIPTGEVDESNPEEIAARLVEKWLSRFKTGEVSWASRLIDYQIIKIDVARGKDSWVSSATFSVKPGRWSFNNWQAGGGTVESDWIRHKSTRFVITKTEGGYKLQELGPGPL
jgi:hypothetical protein